MCSDWLEQTKKMTFEGLQEESPWSVPSHPTLAKIWLDHAENVGQKLGHHLCLLSHLMEKN
jgi:hypothetical protein